MDTSVDTIVKLLSNSGLVGGLLLVIMGNQKGWWISGREAEALRQEIADWKAVAQRSQNVVQTVVQK